jgi:hypothetical protein
MCCAFRKDPQREFFIKPQRGPKKTADKQDSMRERIIALRKQNLSIYDIAKRLKADGRSLTPPAIAAVLKKEGFSRLPRRPDDQRPRRNGPDKAPVADVGELDLRPRSFSTKFGGLFLFLPTLARLPFGQIIANAAFPGTNVIPADHAVRSILALKLFGTARHTHVMSDVFDEGLGLFAGLNVIPKASFLSQYSCDQGSRLRTRDIFRPGLPYDPLLWRKPNASKTLPFKKESPAEGDPCLCSQ